MKLIHLFTSMVFVTLLLGCGDSDGSGSIAGMPDPDRDIIIDGTGVLVTGVIEDFGSVIVDGERYLTEGTEVYESGELLSGDIKDKLSVGDFISLYVVSTPGSSNQLAKQIFHNPPVQGAITAIDEVAGTIEVLGQIVLINDKTVFDDDFTIASIKGLNIGDLVEVSGRSNVGDRILATRLDASILSRAALGGMLTNLDSTQQTFVIRNIFVDYSNVDNASTLVLSDDDSVTVYGEIVEGIFVASSLQMNQAGFVSVNLSINSVSTNGAALGFDGESFIVDDKKIFIDSSTEFVGGVTNDLFESPIVKVSALKETQSGRFVASKITFLGSDISEISFLGVLMAVDLSPSQEAVTAVLSVLVSEPTEESTELLVGALVEVFVNETTDLLYFRIGSTLDDSVPDIMNSFEPISAAELEIGSAVSIVSFRQGNGYVASQVVLLDSGLDSSGL